MSGQRRSFGANGPQIGSRRNWKHNESKLSDMREAEDEMMILVNIKLGIIRYPTSHTSLVIGIAYREVMAGRVYSSFRVSHSNFI